MIEEVQFLGYIGVVGAVFLAVLPVPNILAVVLLVLGVVCFMTASKELRKLFVKADMKNKEVEAKKAKNKSKCERAIKVANWYYNNLQREEEEAFWRSHKA